MVYWQDDTSSPAPGKLMSMVCSAEGRKKKFEPKSEVKLSFLKLSRDSVRLCYQAAVLALRAPSETDGGKGPYRKAEGMPLSPVLVPGFLLNKVSGTRDKQWLLSLWTSTGHLRLGLFPPSPCFPQWANLTF